MHQVTTLTFFRYTTVNKKFWALKMMGNAHRGLSSVNQQTFYKLLGSGRGMGFNPLPDWNVYALIQVWDSMEGAQEFHKNHPLADEFRSNAEDYWTLYLNPIRSEGKWNGSNPFPAPTVPIHKGKPVAVLTRATIKKRYLSRFWSYVPVSQRPLKNEDGLLFAKGIGEIPLAQMATFSIWKDEERMKAFAYGSREHQKAIRKTRELGWYREELFARFQPVASVGSWNGHDPLEGLI